MTDKGDTTPPDKSASASLPPEFSEAFAAVLDFKNRAEAAMIAAEEANRKANSESGFAFNAKQNAEDHAKAIAQVRGSVDADTTWFTTTKKNADEAAEAILTARKAAEADARLMAEAKSTAEAAVVAMRGAQEKGDTSISAVDKAKEEASALLKRATDDSAAITQARANSDASANAVQALQGQVSEAAVRAQTDATTIASRNAESVAILTSLQSVRETATAANDQVQIYRSELAELTKNYALLTSKIESLLPGATSAGLASAFRDQKARFDRPQRIWFWTFSVTLALLFAVGALSYFQLPRQDLTWELLRIHVVSRLPVAVPLIWLALYAGRNYMLALRLQEDYAYKEAISTAFEGYRREMANVTATGEQLVPVLILCENVLKTLGQRPGRLYDGTHEDVTPLTPFRNFLKDIGFKRGPDKIEG